MGLISIQCKMFVLDRNDIYDAQHAVCVELNEKREATRGMRMFTRFPFESIDCTSLGPSSDLR